MRRSCGVGCERTGRVTAAALASFLGAGGAGGGLGGDRKAMSSSSRLGGGGGGGGGASSGFFPKVISSASKGFCDSFFSTTTLRDTVPLFPPPVFGAARFTGADRAAPITTTRTGCRRRTRKRGAAHPRLPRARDDMIGRHRLTGFVSMSYDARRRRLDVVGNFLEVFCSSPAPPAQCRPFANHSARRQLQCAAQSRRSPRAMCRLRNTSLVALLSLVLLPLAVAGADAANATSSVGAPADSCAARPAPRPECPPGT